MVPQMMLRADSRILVVTAVFAALLFGVFGGVLVAPAATLDDEKPAADPAAEKKAEDEKKAESEKAEKPVAEKAKDEKPEPKSAMVVQLTLRGSIEDSVAEENPFGASRLNFRGLLDLIRKAGQDPAVAAIYLRSESPEIGLAKARELIAGFEEFKAAGKKIYAYTEQPTTIDLILLSVANRIEAPEAALAILPGVMAEAFYMKPLFDRLGVRFLVSHVGEYKSAFENFARKEMSPAFREVLEGLVESRYRAIVEIISKGRSIPAEQVVEAIDRSCLTGADLRDLGLVDEVASVDHFIGDIKADLGVDTLKLATSYGRRSMQIDTQNPFALFKVLMEVFSPPQQRSSEEPKLALIYANGVIVSGKSQASPFGGGSTLGSDTLVDAIQAAAKDDTVKAIVLRIDSPGGSGVASDAIWHALVQAKKKKPLVASMSDVAGSGGYYIAMAADRIVADPETLTGSIGVVSAFVNLSGTMDLLGIRVERVSRGKNAAGLSPFADPEQVSLEPLRRVMESFYWQFVDKAAEGRKKTREEIHAVAQGRVWTGADAVTKGLVDELGGLRRAVQIAKELAKVPADDRLELLELPPAPNVFEALNEAFGNALARSRLDAQLPGDALRLGALAPDLLTLAAGDSEANRALERIVHFLRAARDRVVLLQPFDVKIR